MPYSPCSRARARDAASIGVTGPTRTSRRSAAATERLAPAADVAIFVLFTNLGSGLTMALGRWLDAAEADDDGEATAARPLVPIERRELGGRRAQHPAWRIPPH